MFAHFATPIPPTNSSPTAEGKDSGSQADAAHGDSAPAWGHDALRPSPGGGKNPSACQAPLLKLAPWAGFYVALLAALAWVFFHCYLVFTVTVRLCEHADRDLPPEKRLPVFLSEIAFDGYIWNSHAENLGRNGNLRLRFTDIDNAPWGREVHWNSALAWYLRGLGELHYAFTHDQPGASLKKSIYLMSIWANPILLMIVIVVFGWLTVQRFGPLAATVVVLGMVSVPTFYEGFMPAYPDHHGLISLFLFGLLYGIAWAGAGWVNPGPVSVFALPRTLAVARQGMIMSALFGAAGLWFSALSTSFALAAVGVAAVLSTPFFLRAGRHSRLEYHPELWKTWALWGAGGALFFYLLEYFPNHLSMRLEINHPVYALAFLGGGWAVYALLAWWAGPKDKAFPWLVLLFCAAACAVLPVLILFGGPAFYIPHDPFMSRLWKNISELLPLLTRLQMGGLTWEVAIGWFPVLLLGVVAIQFSREVDGGTKNLLVFMAIPIVLLTGLQFYQTRWGLLLGPLYCALAAVVIPQLWRLVPKDNVSRIAAVISLLAFAYVFIEPAFRKCFEMVWKQYQAKVGEIPISAGQGLTLLHRQMARALLDDAAGQPVVLLSSPNSSCLLGGFGGFKTLGTLYWENVDGLKNAARLLNAQSDEETLALLQKHGVTHVSLMTWENFIEPYFRILYPDVPIIVQNGTLQIIPGVKSPAHSFGIRALFNRVIPVFTRPLIFLPNDLTKALQQSVLLLRVDPAQTPNVAKFHMARFVRLVENNPVRAKMVLEELENDPTLADPVRAELAFLCLQDRRYEFASKYLLAALQSSDPAFRESIALEGSTALLAGNQVEAAKGVLAEAAARPDATEETLSRAVWIFCTLPQLDLRDPTAATPWMERLARGPSAGSPRFALLQAAWAGARGDYAEALRLAQWAQETGRQDPVTAEISRQMIEAFAQEKPWTAPATTP